MNSLSQFVTVPIPTINTHLTVIYLARRKQALLFLCGSPEQKWLACYNNKIHDSLNTLVNSHTLAS